MTIRVLLAGGIGSGKSTAAGFLAAFGAHVISADDIGHSVLEPDGAAFEAVARRWPDVVDGGRIDRAALAVAVFSNPDELRELEEITHPAIRSLIGDEVAAVEAQVSVVEVPLIGDFMGDGWLRVVVDAPDQVRFERLLERGMDPDEVLRRMAVQPTRIEWITSADHVIDNGEDLEHLRAESRRVWDLLLRLGAG
jgi:dephospho-CoA kinase